MICTVRPNQSSNTCSLYFLHYIFQLCYNAGISFKTIIIVYYSFVFGHGLLFTFTIFPKDLPDSTQMDITDNGGNNEKDFSSSNTDGNDLKTDTNGLLKSENVFTASGQTKENYSDNIQIQEKRHDSRYASNRKFHAGTHFEIETNQYQPWVN